MTPKKRHKRVIIWTGDAGRAPDGSRYYLFSEHIRGESRQWWAEAPRGRVLNHPTDDWAVSRDKAIQAAEHDFRVKSGAEAGE